MANTVPDELRQVCQDYLKKKATTEQVRKIESRYPTLMVHLTKDSFTIEHKRGTLSTSL